MSSIGPDFKPKKVGDSSFLKSKEKHLIKVINTKGYLFINDQSELGVTDNLLLAKSLRPQTTAYLNAIDSKINKTVMDQLKIRLIEESLDQTVLSMPPSETTKLLRKHLLEHGLTSTLKLLNEISLKKQQLGLRYNSVDRWPDAKTTTLLHLVPNLRNKAVNPAPKPLGLLGVMEPNLEKTHSIGKLLLSDAEILMLDQKKLEQLLDPLHPEEKKKVLKLKTDLDSFYKNKSYVPFSAEGKQFYITIPTAPYAPNQFLVLTTPAREDIFFLEDQEKMKLLKGSIDTSPRGSKTLETIPDLRLGLEQAASLRQSTEKTSRPQSILKNETDVESMLLILKELSENSFIGQNSPETSSDANYQHFQVFLDAPVEQIPLFNISSTKSSELAKPGLEIHKLSEKEFPATIYKFGFSHNTSTIRAFLKELQDRFLKTTKEGSSLNVVARKLPDSTYECYFILRKSILTHPELQTQAVAKGSNRPGWMEMCGVRIAKTSEEFLKLPDEAYTKDVLSLFKVPTTETTLFEKLIKNVRLGE